ncbi:ATP-dependent DNA helicase PIF1-like [Nylanderia fulva]|uniref:ATP-dependent DNA helicase PIF1-like n=1 Tax=Nylanderia fulva TaxID=613905 RepID=UPI0010FB150E|nr:ATP-dependent DNA helicase PIF1-like [Nylanderia fulva]
MKPENYFFALLLMFKPWQKLEDLKNECDTYTESFHKVKLHLKEALQYHEKLEELQKAFETAKQLVQQCLDDDLQKEQSQDDPENAIGIQNLEAGEAMQDFKDLGDRAIQEIDVSDMIVKLNTDQKRVFDKVTNAVESDKSILRLYVSEEGGTGKSFLIKTIKCWIKQNLNKDTAVTAPTGIAAFNIDGLTVHRLLQLPVEHGQTHKYKQLSDCVLKVLRTDLKDVILFVIDEVSMISNLTLIYIHLRLSEIFDTSDCDDGWFGRKHILLFGDLLQLPPVREDLIFTHLSDQKIANYLGSLNAVNLWITLFEYNELIINMRQQGDNSYRELLSRIRIGLVTKSDCKILESRKISFKADSFESRLNELCDFINSLSSDTVCLFPTCNMCDVLNNAMLSRITSKEILLIAEDTIDCTSYVKKKVLKVLSNNDDDSSRTARLSKQITIKIGAKVMIRRNIDASLGLVNGTIAKVISIVRETSTDDVEKIKLLLPSGLEYEIERVTAKFQVLDRAYVIRKQFPLSLSYGITIHKSQGLSLQSVVMDIGNSVFSCGQIYVALSRVTSLEGVHLINFDPSAVIANKKVIIEYNRLKQIYNPKAEMIAVSKERCRKVKDVPWALPKIVTSVQKSNSDRKIQHTVSNKRIQSTAWIIRGFQNTDKISCYANTVLQCLLHLNIIRQQLINCNKTDVLPQDGKLIKAENKFNLCAVPTTKVLIAGQLYKTMSAILYDSSCTDEGHYNHEVLKLNLSRQLVSKSSITISANMGESGDPIGLPKICS